MSSELNCFRAYDVRGILGSNFDAEIAFRIAKALATHLNAKKVVVGRDNRNSSKEIQSAVMNGLCEAGSHVLDLGMIGTEEMYWGVNYFNACAGIEITASHNPLAYNGLKMVKAFSRPLDKNADIKAIKALAERNNWSTKRRSGQTHDMAKESKETYIRKLLSFIDVSKIKPIKILIDAGHGAAGPVIDLLEKNLDSLGANLTFVKLNCVPDPTFPLGVPNPMVEENRKLTSKAVKDHNADLGVAFDGDFDRCFFFDENGEFVSPEFIIGFLAEKMLLNKPGKIVHDLRAIWNIREIVSKNNGDAVISKSGHSNFKQKMFNARAIYGAELSSHHYFKGFFYCDSGMIPWLQILELLSEKQISMSRLVNIRRNLFSSSGEINIDVKDRICSMNEVKAYYAPKCLSMSEFDGLSFEFNKWRFNLRKSETESCLRLNIESNSTGFDFGRKVKKIRELVGDLN